VSRLRWPKRGESAQEDASVEATEAAEAPSSQAPTIHESAETAAEPANVTDDDVDTAIKWRVNWSRVLAYGLLPAIALLLGAAAGYLKWQDNSERSADIARNESVQAAKNSTIAMLSYRPDTVEKQLNDARELMTGEFRDSYTSLINGMVIPGAKEKQISAVASIPAAASVSADPKEAVVLVFVNQTTVVGKSAPTDTASTVRLTLRKAGDRWLISKFEPV
jgi:Mce-associated membrane protein